MALSDYSGPQLPGAYRIEGRITVNYATFTKVLFRVPGYFGAEPHATVDHTLGVLKEVNLRLVSGTSLDVADVDATSNARYNSIDANNRTIQKKYRTAWEWDHQWWRTSGAIVIEYEIFFDAPGNVPAGE